MVEYPTADEIHMIHDQIVENSTATDPGVRSPESVESAIVYVSEGYFGKVPETIHEKAAHLIRLLVSEHPYVDGNKRTALATTFRFYDENGYRFDPDDEIRQILKSFATDSDNVDIDSVVKYLEQHTEPK